MKRVFVVLIAFITLSCSSNNEPKKETRLGRFAGVFEYGNFSDDIQFEIEEDSAGIHVFFTSLAQNANRIPFQSVETNGDSISFRLQSDFYTYSFKNKWFDNYSRLEGSLTVDTITATYSLTKELKGEDSVAKSREVTFASDGLNLHGTIWYSDENDKGALVILTSSGNADRSSSRAEAILFAQMGFTTFHYDKRGTGNSEGNWQTATMEELLLDDVNAIKYFSDEAGVPMTNIGVKGSSQGATKVPFVLGELEDLKYGIVVSCPGGSLLESDLNYWKNGNVEMLGDKIEDAARLQRKVFEFIAGEMSKADLENAVNQGRSKSWFSNVWIPNLDEVEIDTKLLYSPIPYFERLKQPILIMQGTLDEIIPVNSHKVIAEALLKSGNNNFESVLVNGASHSMHNVGQSDFPYWSKLHSSYLTTIEGWLDKIN